MKKLKVTLATLMLVTVLSLTSCDNKKKEDASAENLESQVEENTATEPATPTENSNTESPASSEEAEKPSEETPAASENAK